MRWRQNSNTHHLIITQDTSRASCALRSKTSDRHRLVHRSEPWTDEHDAALRKAVLRYDYDPSRPKPWTVIATRLNFGHNSGSCAKRWDEIRLVGASVWEEGDRFVFSGCGAAGGEPTVRIFKGPYSREITP